MSLASCSRAALVAISAVLASSALAITPSSGGTVSSPSGTVVAFDGDYRPGTIVVRTKERKLYLVFGFGRAIQHPCRRRASWTGPWPAVLTSVGQTRPSELGAAGRYSARQAGPAGCDSRRCPVSLMGVAAMTIADSEYAIHGTNSPKSIGRYVSYGCIRMFNKDIMDLYGRVWVGTPVIVIR